MCTGHHMAEHRANRTGFIADSLWRPPISPCTGKAKALLEGSATRVHLALHNGVKTPSCTFCWGPQTTVHGHLSVDCGFPSELSDSPGLCPHLLQKFTVIPIVLVARDGAGEFCAGGKATNFSHREEARLASQAN